MGNTFVDEDVVDLVDEMSTLSTEEKLDDLGIEY